MKVPEQYHKILSLWFLNQSPSVLCMRLGFQCSIHDYACYWPMTVAVMSQQGINYNRQLLATTSTDYLPCLRQKQYFRCGPLDMRTMKMKTYVRLRN